MTGQERSFAGDKEITGSWGRPLKLIKSVTPDTPVILMSANARLKQIAAAKRYGAVTILTKQIDFPQDLSLLSRLRKVESGQEWKARGKLRMRTAGEDN